MDNIRALVAAAGRGTRAGLPYPKTLFPVQGSPILLRILALLRPYDGDPVVIVSPDGDVPVRQCLAEAQVTAELVMQREARGMGDAVLHLEKSTACSATNILLIWGDIPFIQAETVSAIVEAHQAHANDFTLATCKVEQAYTVVSRDAAGAVTGVVETREEGIMEPQPGERDIGLFIFRKESVLPLLRQELPRKWGRKTGEHGFLYVIEHLCRQGFRVEALPVATAMDLVSLNSMEDLRGFL